MKRKIGRFSSANTYLRIDYSGEEHVEVRRPQYMYIY